MGVGATDQAEDSRASASSQYRQRAAATMRENGDRSLSNESRAATEKNMENPGVRVGVG